MKLNLFFISSTFYAKKVFIKQLIDKSIMLLESNACLLSIVARLLENGIILMVFQ